MVLSTGIPAIKIPDEDCLKLRDCIGTEEDGVTKASVGFLLGESSSPSCSPIRIFSTDLLQGCWGRAL